MMHIWHEDSENSATTQFWKFLTFYKVCFDISCADIRGFSGNQNLLDFVSSVTFNRRDIYIIFMDFVYDNPRVLQIYSELKEITYKKSNVVVADLLSFEYLILSFKYFENWIKPLVVTNKYKYLCEVRRELLRCVNDMELPIRYPLLVEYMKYSFPSRNIVTITTEQLATHLLSDFTSSLKGDFSITKKHLGSCWTCNCCDKYTKDLVKKCSHAENKKTGKEKALNLYHNTLAHAYL